MSDIEADRAGDHLQDDAEEYHAPTEDGEELQRPVALAEFGPSPPFGTIMELFELIAASRDKRMKTTEKGKYKQDLIRKFFQVSASTVRLSTEADVAEQFYRELVGLDLLPVVRLMVPGRSCPPTRR